MNADPVTLREVAEEAGVSVSTASRALTGKAEQYRISKKTERSIRDVAERLGFRPSHLARSLRNQRTGLVGVLVPDVSNSFFSAIAREVTRCAREQGYDVLLVDSQESTACEEQLLGHLQSRQIEGLVLCPVGESAEHLQAFEAKGIPVVMVDRCFSQLNLTTVTSDHQSGTEALMAELLQKGHRVIGCLQGRVGTLPNNERIVGYRQSLKAWNIPFDRSLIAGDQFDELSGYRAASHLLSTHVGMTAMFAFSNQILLGALRAINERKLSIPKDISLVTFDDPPFAEFLAAPITSAKQDVPLLGKTAAELLLRQLKGHESPKNQIYRIPVEILPRKSIATCSFH
ncbi:Ribose operon repressor RbsR [Planctomycetales bacterium 10988]|nr:Ribose operon repressor RbsR [Planctomycetales bacterium 10988]